MKDLIQHGRTLETVMEQTKIKVKVNKADTTAVIALMRFKTLNKKNLSNGPRQPTCSESISRLPDKQPKTFHTLTLRKLKQNSLKANRVNACGSKIKCLTKHNESLRKCKLSQKCSTSKNSSISTLQRKISTVNRSSNKKSKPKQVNKRF